MLTLKGAAIAARLLLFLILVGTKKHPRLRVYLFATFCVNLVKAQLPSLIVHPPPFTGLDKLVFLFDGALFTVSPVILGWAVGGQTWKPLAGLWATVLAGVALAYPSIRGDALERLYLAELVTAHIAVLAAFIVRATRKKHKATVEDAAYGSLAVLGLSGSVLAVTWPEDWGVIQIANLTTYTMLCALHIRTHWNTV